MYPAESIAGLVEIRAAAPLRKSAINDSTDPVFRASESVLVSTFSHHCHLWMNLQPARSRVGTADLVGMKQWIA